MDDARMTDGELVGRIVAGGEDEAFQELVKRHGAMVLRTCRRVTLNLDDAEDAAQMVFATLCARAEELQSYRSLAGWSATSRTRRPASPATTCRKSPV